MTEADISFAIKVTDLEAWGYSEADFRRLLRLDPRGCFKAMVGGRRVGITTTTSYGEVGWIGNVIVLPMYRGRGIGQQLVEEAVEYLEGRGARTIRLNSYVDTTGFYEVLGFKKEFENVRFNGKLAATKQPITVAKSKSMKRITEFDKRYFGASRQRLLSILAREFQETFLVSEGESIDGFLVGQTAENSCEVAPFVCARGRQAAAKTLWLDLSAKLPGAAVAFTAPSVSKQALRFANWAGLTAGFKTLRMCKGRRNYVGRPEGIIGLGGLEKG